MLLIFPPIVKPCEPPPGVALLSAALKEHGLPCEVLDANIEGILFLIRKNKLKNDKPRNNNRQNPIQNSINDRWSKRAIKNREQILKDLRNPLIYKNDSQYNQRVYDLNRALFISADTSRFKLSLSDYSDRLLSPVNSRDLMQSAHEYKENPFYPYFEGCLKKRLENSCSAFVGISLCYLSQALTAFALAGWIKDNFKEKKIIMGGGLISSWMSHPDYSHPFNGLVDICIRGEGERPLLKLLSDREAIDKRSYVPDYDFVNRKLYMAPGLILPFRSSSGCYWSKCSFCPEKAENSSFRTQKADKILDQLRSLNEKYQADYVHFIDNAVPPAFLRAMSREKFPFKWYGFARFEKDLLNLDYCKTLKRAGCDMLKLGLESGDQNVLSRMNKGTDLNTASLILQNLYEAGILSYVYLLFGTIYEDEAAAYKTLNFVKAHDKFIDYLNLSVFNLPCFSEDIEKVETTQFYDADLSLYMDFKHPLGWDRKKIKHFISKVFRKELAKRGHILRVPAFFSSNHAAFFKQYEI